MKIGILLPYKENFSPEYPGAVSLFVNETSLKSRFKKNIVVFGSTNFKKRFKLRYENINLFPNPLKSQTKSYVKKFINIQKRFDFSIIEKRFKQKSISFVFSQRSTLNGWFKNY